jgi:prevent-host-death family protein
MRRIEIGNATEPLSEYAQRADAGPLVVTVDGRPIAALVPLEDTDLESLALGADPGFVDIIDRSRRRQAEEGGLSNEEMRRRFANE